MKLSNFWKSSFGFTALTFVSRVFGYIRDLMFSSILGANVVHDIFVVIFKIPNVFRSFFGEGALAQSLTPSIIEAKENLHAFLNQIFTVLFSVLAAFVLFVMLFPSIFVSIFAPGFISDEAKFLAASQFLGYVFPYILLISLVAFLGAVQNSRKRFQVVAATPILFNLTLIGFACFAEDLTLEVIGASVILAGILQLLLNLFVK